MAQAKHLSLLIVLVVGVVAGTISLLFFLGPKPESLSQVRSVYDTPVPVADFTLTDQTGSSFAFSSTKGKVVVMAFLFTHCADVCPFSAIKMRLALEQLGDRAQDVELVVVTTDAERDTVPVIAAYSKELGLYDQWHYVTGDPQALLQVYKNLKITVIKAEKEEMPAHAQDASDHGIEVPSRPASDSPLYGLTDAQIAAGSAVAQKYSGGYDIAHAAPFWVVDKDGMVRASLDVSASPSQIVEAVQTYL